MSLVSFMLLSLAFFSLPLHSSPASMGAAVLLIVISILVYFVSMNMTLAAIFVTLVYISGILILFSYFFSLIQNVKIFFVPLAVGAGSTFLLLLALYYQYFNQVSVKMIYTHSGSHQSSFTWMLMDLKLIFFIVLILLLSMLFIEKVIGLKQKPLRVK